MRRCADVRRHHTAGAGKHTRTRTHPRRRPSTNNQRAGRLTMMSAAAAPVSTCQQGAPDAGIPCHTHAPAASSGCGVGGTASRAMAEPRVHAAHSEGGMAPAQPPARAVLPDGSRPRSAVAMVREQVARHPDKVVYRWLNGGGAETDNMTLADAWQRSGAIAQRLMSPPVSLRRGDRAMITFPIGAVRGDCTVLLHMCAAQRRHARSGSPVVLAHCADLCDLCDLR